MPKRRRPRGPRRELLPVHARPLDPESCRVACLQALAISTAPHPLLHEWVSPHVILRDGAEETAIQVTDNPIARAMLTSRDHDGDQVKYHSACWSLFAIGLLLEQSELAPWVRSRTADGCEIDENIFLVAATAPLIAKGEFLIKPVCAALKCRAEEHPETRGEETPAC